MFHTLNAFPSFFSSSPVSFFITAATAISILVVVTATNWINLKGKEVIYASPLRARTTENYRNFTHFGSEKKAKTKLLAVVHLNVCHPLQQLHSSIINKLFNGNEMFDGDVICEDRETVMGSDLDESAVVSWWCAVWGAPIVMVSHQIDDDNRTVNGRRRGWGPSIVS